jgi:hypothetical protein
MDGTINGSLTIMKGSESCQLEGIMEEGTPLGQAHVHFEQVVPLIRETEPAPARTPAGAQGEQRTQGGASTRAGINAPLFP